MPVVEFLGPLRGSPVQIGTIQSPTAATAQLAAHRPDNPKVVSSIPTRRVPVNVAVDVAVAVNVAVAIAGARVLRAPGLPDALGGSCSAAPPAIPIVPDG